MDKLPEVLQEVPRVRAELGYPPLVTPMSQIVGTQAVVNVVTGQRYKMIPQEVKAYVKGLYGKPPGPIDDEIRKKIIGDEEVITGRPADLLEPGLEKGYAEVSQYIQKEEDLLSYILFPPVALKYLRERMTETYKVDFGMIEDIDEDMGASWYPV
jgi:oxaloacetate decarboxylase alpha subunit